MSRDKYIHPDTMNDRQKWAAGALAEKFYQAGTLRTISPEKDQSGREFLEQAGYEDHEIASIIDHMNACAEIISDMPDVAYKIWACGVEKSIREGIHNTPAPK